MLPIIGFDSEEISGVLRGSSFHGEVGPEAACSGLRGDWGGGGGKGRTRGNSNLANKMRRAVVGS